MKFTHLHLCLPTLAIVIAGACQSRPEAGLAQAKRALDTARAVEAPLCAEAEFRTSEQAFESAEAELFNEDRVFVLMRNYTHALELITEARTEAQRAAIAAGVNKSETIRESKR